MNVSTETLISVVVPFYGGEEYVEQCIDSILSQTHRNLEIILVNDGSPDRSGEICNHAASLDHRIRVIHQENSGLVSARKAGVSIATGKYLGFVDGDDWVGPEYFGDMHELMAANAADLAISGHVRDFMGKQEPIAPLLSDGVFEQFDIHKSILPTAIFNGTFFQHGVSTYVWNKLFKREKAARFVREIPLDIVLGEDAALTYPYLHASSRVAVKESGDYFYRQRPESILKSLKGANTEYSQLSTLFQFLNGQIQQSDANSNLTNQLRMYFLALALIRSGGIIHSPTQGNWYSPFSSLSMHKKIVVYSSGSFGQHLVKSLEKLGQFQIAGWIDEDVQESQLLGLAVTSIESIRDLDFDLAVIASVDAGYTEKIAQVLERLGVDRNKISKIQPDFEQLESSLENVGFNLDTFAFRPVTTAQAENL